MRIVASCAVALVLGGQSAVGASPPAIEEGPPIPSVLVRPGFLSPTQDIAEIRQLVNTETDPKNKAILLFMIGRDLSNREAAAYLISYLKDPNEEFRLGAVRGLRLMASRNERCGVQVKIGPPAPAPRVEGLVPNLIEATNDSSWRVRDLAMYALADSREDLAAARLRELLRDPETETCFVAACLLTEFNDFTGLPELKRELARLQTQKRSVLTFLKAESLFAALERSTGKHFGKLPGNPIACSNPDQAAAIEKRTYELLDAWSQYFTSPAAK